MVEGFDVVKNPQDVSFYAGLLLTSYSICQAITTMYWGPLSDRIGRRPTLLMGLTGDLATFVLFGLSKSYKWAIITRSLNGFFAGNSAVVKSVVTEIADDTNRPRMMALLPLMWNIGAVAGAAVGGLLADPTNQYPSIFGRCEIFRTYPYLLPCLVGSLTTTFGLIVGLFKLKETLVIEPAIADVAARETGVATESTPLVSSAPQQHGKPPAHSMLSLLTPTSKYVMATNLLMCLAIAMGDQIYPIFAASAPVDGGLGFSTQDIGISLSVSSVAVLYLQLVAYPKLVQKYGALTCCQMGLKIMTPFFFAMPFLSLLSSSIESMIAGKTFVRLPMPADWVSFAGFEYCMLWILLIGLLLVRITGNVLAFTSLNLLVSNIAPSKATLGTMNEDEQPGSGTATPKETPLPWAQLSPLLAIRLAEPVNMTLCMPFLYKMVESFDIVKHPEDVPFYAGLLLTSYSLCQAIPSMYWGVLSDRIGRRPALLIGLAGDLATFVLFGLSKSFTWAIVTRSLNGVFAGNSAVVKSVVAEISDDSNRPRMTALLPLMWNIGVVAGSAVGGLLADPANQYPSIFGRCEIFRTFPYLLPCLVGSLTTAMGLFVGLFKLKETLVITPVAVVPEAQESGAISESTPLVAQQSSEQQSMLSLLTPTCRRVLTINILMCLAISMYYHIYSMFAASPPRDGGLGFNTQGIGISLAISGLVVIYLQLVAYPKLVQKYGTLRCCQIGLLGMVPVFFAIPFLSLLSARVERLIGDRVPVDLLVSQSWISRAGLEYSMLWTLLLALLLARMVGDILAFTSINLIVSNIAPTKTTLGAMNGMQQFSSTCTRIVGPMLSGTLWGWSIKHKMVYPINSHLVWVLCGVLIAVSWKMSMSLPSSVNVFASGQLPRRRQ
ncbi:hypothetical protein GGH12_001978 [Coemansia sp. RSA 1822]|nr:hypothetical protein GGH12_001978 [Coemansia sp. RSA 1822]